MKNDRKFIFRALMACLAMSLAVFVILTCPAALRTVSAQNPATEKVLYSFRPATGQIPTNVVRDTSGNLYVATEQGGSTHGGTILKLSLSGIPTVLYAFPLGIGREPANPLALTRDSAGNLFGSTAFGGHFSRGSVFKLTSSGTETTLHNFDPFAGDGSNPGGGVTLDSEGNIYGTTSVGAGLGCLGQGCGIIYKLTPSGTERILYTFTGGTDGGLPEGAVALDASGNIYGTAVEGGDLNCAPAPGVGCGTVWKLDTSGNFTVLYTFTGGTDGGFPATGLLMDPLGNLYGPASSGGDLSCDFGQGCGTVFKIDASGNFTTLYSFIGGSGDGQNPASTLIRDGSGNLYGIAAGGNQACANGCGVVFKLDASNNETILHFFTGGTTDGAYPESALTTDGKGNLYGTTFGGGLVNGGVIFKVQTQ